MKYMRLGVKPDIFRTDDHDNITTVANDLPSDLAIQVEDHLFYLHKFPLLSKCSRLQELVPHDRVIMDSQLQHANGRLIHGHALVPLAEVPGGAHAFGLCARFCYGITITLNARNVLAARCAAEYLGMTESADRGNLVFKLEVFLSSNVLRSWKDSIVALRSTRSMVHAPSHGLKLLVSRCVDAVASKTSVDPSNVDWSFTYARKRPASTCAAANVDTSASSRQGTSHSQYATSDRAQSQNGTDDSQNGLQSAGQIRKTGFALVPSDWWVEDICDLDADFFYRVIVSIKAKGRMSGRLIGEALRVYAYRWLPGISKQAHVAGSCHGQDPLSTAAHCAALEHKYILERIVQLMPNEKGSCSCSFMLRLLKAGAILGVEDNTRLKLARKIGLQLDEASFHDLLIPCLSYATDVLYDVDLVQHILDHFLLRRTPRPLPESESTDTLAKVNIKELERWCNGTSTHLRATVDSDDYLEFDDSNEDDGSSCRTDMNVVPDNSILKVGKLIDGYLVEVARDPNLSLEKFVTLAETIPAFARPMHDDLYRAIDIYLKEHLELTKDEKKRLCKLMDCKKLSAEASMHAAQNERLPLRVVVQVLFCEQARTTSMAKQVGLPNEEQVSISAHDRTATNMITECAELEHQGSTNNDMTQGTFIACKPSLKTNVFSNSKKILNKILSIYSSSSVSIGSNTKLECNISKSSGGGSSGVSMSSSTTTIAPSKELVKMVDTNFNKTPSKVSIRHRHSIS